MHVATCTLYVVIIKDILFIVRSSEINKRSELNVETSNGTCDEGKRERERRGREDGKKRKSRKRERERVEGEKAN